MAPRLKPKTEILLAAQQEILPQLAATSDLSLVLYGGTAVALHLGHRISVDFDFFSSAPLEKVRIRSSLPFMPSARIGQEDPHTLVVEAAMPSGPVKVSFFGGIQIGRINDPLPTDPGMLLVASLEDLLATKLKTILQRAEAKDYQDIAAMLSAGVSLERALGAFAKMYHNDPATALRAIGYFEDGDLSLLPNSDRNVLLTARDRVMDIPVIALLDGLCPPAAAS
jgi:hypothetical protein